MSLLDPTQVFRVPGRLVVNPTQLGLAGAYPHGGIAIGYFENGELVIDQESESVISEATGKRVATLLAETIIGFEFDFVQFDLDMLKKHYALTGTTTLREPSTGGSVSPGLQPVGQPLLFAPVDVLLHPGLLIFNPAYRHGLGKRVPHELGDKRRDRVIVDANDDANGHTWACDLLSALSLT